MLIPGAEKLGPVLAAAALTLTVAAVPPGDPVNGMRPAGPRVHAIVGAAVVTHPGARLERATVVIERGLIVAVGPDVAVPPGARTWPGDGLTLYPGLLDAGVRVEGAELPEGPGRHWNAQIRAERDLATGPLPAASLRKTLRDAGFAVAAFHPDSGILRGRGVVAALADDEHGPIVYDAPVRPQVAGFDRGRGGYPGSKMGVIALVRQTLLDTGWHAASTRAFERDPERNPPPPAADALTALRPVLDHRSGRGAPILFDVRDEQDALRAVRLADEFDFELWLLGSGLEFRRLEAIAASGAPIIVPLEFPARPRIDSVAGADGVSLRDLMSWEQGPTNPRRLVEAGVEVALTTERLRRRSDVRERLAAAIRHGLDEDDALAALTTTPAALLGLEEHVGRIAPGFAAHLVAVEGSLFDPGAPIRATWVAGERYEVTAVDDAPSFAGTLEIEGGSALEAEIDLGRPSARFRAGGEDAAWVAAASTAAGGDRLSVVLDARILGGQGYASLEGTLVGEMLAGTIRMPDGERRTFTMRTDRPLEPAGPAEADPRPAAAAPGAGDPVSGTWTMSVQTAGTAEAFTVSADLALDGAAVRGTVLLQGEPISTRGRWDADGNGLVLTFDLPGGGDATMTGTVDGARLVGRVEGADFAATIEGSRVAAGPAAPAGADGVPAEAPDVPFEMPPETLLAPLGAYGVAARPAPRDVLLVKATIWTCGEAGVIEGGAMLVVDGRIEAVYAAGEVPAALDVEMIDLAGAHVTPGLIDCHSHTGISAGINEFGQTNTAEVRIGDVIDPDDINWYRQLAGGLTAANQLHGSANPIGGQNSVVKLRWGGLAEDFPIADAKPGIKFALGENVIRSTSRYPNTRMGVEAFLRDAFTAAREYGAARERHRALPPGERSRLAPPRRDLELDTLLEILDGERIIHCHSYRQDEILMLIRVAESFGFTIGTFQHVLEGFKVADAIAAHGAGASSFSDWWAYKVEVMDAIPHNGTLMTSVGVSVSFNSDSSELARRMNTEAAKAVRYGGLDPHEALKLVTLNPAQQLGIGHRTGSLEPGKDADFAVWSAAPLSTYARCEQTWIEGALLFDRAGEAERRAWIDAERERLIQKVLVAAHGAPADEGEAAEDGHEDGHGHETDEALAAFYEEQLRLGNDPHEIRPGECGCGMGAHR